jgi:hypothetical protein
MACDARSLLKHASGMQGVTGLHGPASILWITTVAEGLGMRAVARVFEVDPNTVLAWLVEAADHDTAFFRYCRDSAGCGYTTHHKNHNMYEKSASVQTPGAQMAWLAQDAGEPTQQGVSHQPPRRLRG